MTPPSLMLLVEDNGLIAMDMQELLEEAGFEVHYAPDGETALTALNIQAMTLSGLVTDIRLGSKVDGWAVANRARELNGDLPVVYVTGDSAHEHTQKGVPKSIILQKPFEADTLMAAVETALNL